MIPIKRLHWPDERDLAVIHFEPAYKHARHYLVAALPGRLRNAVWNQRKGRGAALTRAAAAAGCRMYCTAIIRLADTARERNARHHSKASEWCWICSGAANCHTPPGYREMRLREARILRKYSQQSFERWRAETNPE